MTVALAAFTLGAAPAPVPTLPEKSPPPARVAPVDPAIPVALLVDLSSGQTLFAREPDRRFMPASVTKVMTAYTAFRLIEEGRLSPEASVTISREIAEIWSGEGSSMFLQAGDQVTVGELILGVTTVSANDGAVALAVFAGWRGARPSQPHLGVRMVPWRFVMVLSCVAVFVLIVHLAALMGVLPPAR